MGELEKAVRRLRELGATEDEVRAYIQENAPKFAMQARAAQPGASAFDGKPSGAGRSWGDEPAAPTPPAPTDIVSKIDRALPMQVNGPAVNDVSRAAAQGMTFGFGDEISAAGNAGLEKMVHGGNYRDLYGRNVAHEREELARFRRESPKTAIGAELLGGLATAKIPAIGSLGPVWGGAAYGAAYGAGNAEGELDERARGAATGVVVGAATGGIIKGAGKVGQVAYDVARPVVQPVIKAVGRFAQNIEAPGLTIQGVGRRPPNAMRGRAAPSVREPGPLSSFAPRAPDERADQLLLDRLASDKIPLRALEEAMSNAGNKPVSVIDLAGDNTMGLARGARGVPSRAKQEIPAAIYGRAEGQGVRVRSDLENAAGTTPGDVVTKEESLIASRRAKAQPAYEKAYNAPPIEDPEILSTLKLPQFQQAYKRAVKIAKAEGVELPPLTKKSNVGGVDIEEIVAQPVKTLDYIKRGMDDLIDSKMRSGSMGRTEARALRIRLDDMLKRVDEAVPDYKIARSQFASDSRSLDALAMGREFRKTDGREVARVIKDLTPGERELYAQGALDDLTEAIRNRQDGHDVVATIFGSEDKREALRGLLGKDGFEVLAKAMGVEKRMLRTKGFVLGGSNTADKLAEQIDLERPGVARKILGVLTSNPINSAHLLGWDLLSARLAGVTEETANALAPKLIAGMNGDRKALASVIQQLRAAEQREARRSAVRRAASRPLSGTAGGAASRTGDQR